jgi:hypothetical protein
LVDNNFYCFVYETSESLSKQKEEIFVKRIVSVLMLAMLLLAACIVPPGQQAPGTTIGKPVDLSPAQKMAVQALSAEVKVPVAQIKVVSSKAVEWPDACLGVAQKDVVCAQVITPGYSFLFAAKGQQYEYHTNQDGSQVLPSPVQ